jgi:hypothetical protein
MVQHLFQLLFHKRLSQEQNSEAKVIQFSDYKQKFHHKKQKASISRGSSSESVVRNKSFPKTHQSFKYSSSFLKIQKKSKTSVSFFVIVFYVILIFACLLLFKVLSFHK